MKLPSQSSKRLCGSSYVEIALSLAPKAVMSIGASHIFRDGMLSETCLEILAEKQVTLKMLLGPTQFDLTQLPVES